MPRLLVAVLLLLPGSVGATTPAQELVEEIAELRKRVGDRGQVVADQDAFRQALKDAAERAEPRPGGPWGHGPFAPEPPRPPERPRSPEVLLRESAFELDRIAHALEMAERFREADAVRDTAGALRNSARRDGDRPGPRDRARPDRPDRRRGSVRGGPTERLPESFPDLRPDRPRPEDEGDSPGRR